MTDSWVSYDFINEYQTLVAPCLALASPSCRYGHKGIMHEHISKDEAHPRLDGMSDLGVRVPRGYCCSSTQDLLEAYEKLGEGNVTLRPIRATASPGEGVLR